MQVQAIRPVYGSTYETLTLNFNDPDFRVNYSPRRRSSFQKMLMWITSLRC
jgi:hypothetical protein